MLGVLVVLFFEPRRRKGREGTINTEIGNRRAEVSKRDRRKMEDRWRSEEEGCLRPEIGGPGEIERQNHFTASPGGIEKNTHFTGRAENGHMG